MLVKEAKFYIKNKNKKHCLTKSYMLVCSCMLLLLFMYDFFFFSTKSPKTGPLLDCMYTDAISDNYTQACQLLIHLQSCAEWFELTDDLRKSRGLNSVSAYRHGLYIYRSMPAGVMQSSHAFVGGTVSTWAR